MCFCGFLIGKRVSRCVTSRSSSCICKKAVNVTVSMHVKGADAFQTILLQVTGQPKEMNRKKEILKFLRISGIEFCLG